MAGVEKEDLRDLRDTLTAIVREESAQTRAEIQAIDDRARALAEDTARHDVKITKLEESDRDQWSQINGLKNGRGAVPPPMTRRQKVSMVGAIGALGVLVEGLHQLAALVLQVVRK